MADRICYRKLPKYKYQLVDTYAVRLKPPPAAAAVPGFIEYGASGDLTIHKGYAWDGPSGPTIDTKNFMRGSLVHDALYQLLREGKLEPWEEWRTYADDLLREMCRQDGMSRVRAWYVHRAVRLFAGGHARPRGPSAPKVICAPR